MFTTSMMAKTRAEGKRKNADEHAADIRQTGKPKPAPRADAAKKSKKAAA
jgi:hypothetical protein